MNDRAVALFENYDLTIKIQERKRSNCGDGAGGGFACR